MKIYALHGGERKIFPVKRKYWLVSGLLILFHLLYCGNVEADKLSTDSITQTAKHDSQSQDKCHHDACFQTDHCDEKTLCEISSSEKETMMVNDDNLLDEPLFPGTSEAKSPANNVLSANDDFAGQTFKSSQSERANVIMLIASIYLVVCVSVFAASWKFLHS